MKRVFAILLAALMLLSVVGCAEKTSTPAGNNTPANDNKPAESTQGKVFNIYAWNEEFKGFFEAYYTVPEGVTVNWIINPSDNGVY